MDVEQNGSIGGGGGVDGHQHHHNQDFNVIIHGNSNGIVGSNFQNRNRNNNFNNCLCQTLLLIRYFPFVMISTLFTWGIYVYMYYIVFNGYHSVVPRILLVLFFMPLFILTIWSYLRTVFTQNRPIPDQYTLPDTVSLNGKQSDEEINQALEQAILARNLPVYTRSYIGRVRYCHKCFVIKPDRCHHCSACAQCIRKMDHHCHWVSNCVAYDNYKYFLQFLSYTFLLAIYTSATSMKQFIKFWKDEDYPGRFQVFFLVVFCSVFSLSILFLLTYHIYLVLKNRTTLEAYQRPRFRNNQHDRYGFDLGACRNFLSIFGDNKLLWLLPVPTTSYGDGLQFDLRLNSAQSDKPMNPFFPDTSENHSDNAASPIMSTLHNDYHNQHKLQYNSQQQDI